MDIAEQEAVLREICDILERNGEDSWAWRYRRFLLHVQAEPYPRKARQKIRAFKKHLPGGMGGATDLVFSKNGEVRREDTNRYHDLVHLLGLPWWRRGKWPTVLALAALSLPWVLGVGYWFVYPQVAKHYNSTHYATWTCDVTSTGKSNVGDGSAVGVVSSNCESFIITKTIDGKSLSAVHDELKPGHTYEVEVGDVQIWPNPTVAQKFTELH